MNPLIYFDYAASTPIAPEVIEKMVQYLGMDGIFANPASKSHYYGWQAQQHIQLARQQVADLIQANPDEIIWTSGATESNNLALKGLALNQPQSIRHIITSQIEHKAILDTCAELELLGFEITYLAPDPTTGLIRSEMVEDAIRPDTFLVSLMMVNNELGTITDILEIGKITKRYNLFLHVDAAQAAGKIKIDVNEMNIDLMSLSAHKVYGPKGIGALYIRNRDELEVKAQMHGGGHEGGYRSGTLATHQIVAMGCAFELASKDMRAEQKRLQGLKKKLFDGLSKLSDLKLNGHSSQCVANCLNISFTSKDADTLIHAIHCVAAVSQGSACNSHSAAVSHVLKALKVNSDIASRTIRFSLGKYTTETDIETFLHNLTHSNHPQWVQFHNT